jgi:hypothetical protein
MEKTNARPNAMSDDVKKIVSSSAAEPFEPELGRLLQPARFFRHPRDVVRDVTLTTAEKRAILSSWRPTPVPSNRCLRSDRCPVPVVSSALTT